MPGPTTCLFANTTLGKGFDFTLAPGVQPSVCTIYTVPHVAQLPRVGLLRFYTSGESPIELPDCLLESPQLVIGSGGQLWNLPIQDRRWKWRFGRIYGSYNVRKPNATYIREKTPRELATLLFTAMGETNFDVSRLPNDARPLMDWSNGAHPATELDALCQSMSCVVCYNPFNNNAEIWPIGEGRALPTGPTNGTAYAPVYPAEPLHIIVDAGPTLFQARFRMEAVGLDTDGKWKPIDNLSYKPSTGWGKANAIGGFPEITGTTFVAGTPVKHRDLARGTVFKCFRAAGLTHNSPATPWALPPSALQDVTRQPNSRKDYQFLDRLADEEIATDDGSLRPLPINVFVKAFRADNPFPTLLDRYPEAVGFDTDNGILRFGELLILADKAGNQTPGEVVLECAFHAGNEGVKDRQAFGETVTVGTIPTQPRLISRPDITRRVVLRYTNDTNTNFTVEDSFATASGHLAHWHSAASFEYGLQNGGTVNYQRLMQISPDGLTQQVSWSGGGGRGPSTVVSQAQRHARYFKPPDEYAERLEVAKQKRAAAEQLAERQALVH